MTRTQFLTLLDRLDRDLRRLTDTKGVEYPQSEDQLANFKRLGVQLGLPPEVVLWVHLEKHLDGLRFFVSGLASGTERIPAEPVDGRIVDAVLYLALLRALITERGYEPTSGNSKA